MNHSNISDDILNGNGYHIFRGVISDNTVNKLLKYVRRGTSSYPDNVRERRLWNLDGNSPLFSEIAMNNNVIPIVEDLLGSRYKMSSLGANRLMPGSLPQEPHADYPYWGLFDKKAFPKNINSSFILGCQIIAPITAFTRENGATAIVPGTQLSCEYPDPVEFDKRKIQVDMAPGDILLYNSLLWHKASENKSNDDRIAMLGQYLAFFVKDFQ